MDATKQLAARQIQRFLSKYENLTRQQLFARMNCRVEYRDFEAVVARLIREGFLAEGENGSLRLVKGENPDELAAAVS